MHLFIPSAPPTANRMWRNGKGREYLSPAMKTFIQLVTVAAMAERFRVPSRWEYVDVAIYVSLRQRSGDVDNRIKPVLDALTRAGVWEDDKIVASVSARMVKTSKTGATWIFLHESAAPKFENWKKFGLTYPNR